jgi:hypothetical protein
MLLLELFSGLKSVSNVFSSHGADVITIDNNMVFRPSFCKDIAGIKTEEFFRFMQKPDVVWASPPCKVFSNMNLKKYWKNDRPRISETFHGIALAKKAVEIIGFLAPKYWFIENPRGKLREMPFMRGLPRKTVTYCQYGFDVRKETDIWTNCLNWIPRPICKKGDRCHTDFRRLGAKDGGVKNMRGFTEMDRAKRAVVPLELCEEIYQACISDEIKQERLHV